MSEKQAVTIVSRAVAIYFLAWFLTDLTYLPYSLHSLWHHQTTIGAFGSSYLRDSDLVSLVFRLVRMIALFLAIQWFYRAGPTIRRYFLAQPDEEAEKPS
jgi:hypothetical protein